MSAERQNFDIHMRLPTNGCFMVEASAGTGKTYSLTGLIARFIVEKGIEIGSILAVTFTRAATFELRERVYRRLKALRRAFAGADAGAVDDPFAVELATRIVDGAVAGVDPATARKRVELAIASLDEAAIYTIHSFCERMLSEFSFESGAIYGAELTGSDSEYFEQARADYWRRYFGPDADREIAAILTMNDFTFEKFLNLDRIHLTAETVYDRIDKAPDLKNAASAYFAAFDLFLQLWNRDHVSQFLFANSRHLAEQTIASAVSHWGEIARSRSSDTVTKKTFEIFTRQTIQNLKGRDPIFDTVCSLKETFMALSGPIATYVAFHRARALDEIRPSLDRTKAVRSILSFDDLIAMMKEAVKKKDDEKKTDSPLAQRIRERFTVALIDEYQDTDPDQAAIFDAVYGGGNHGVAFFVGDPKQSIYAFRGADVHAYLTAREKIPEGHRFDLKDNYRSTPRLIEAVNNLYEKCPEAFVESGIEYHAVNPRQKGVLVNYGSQGAPLTLVVANEDGALPDSKVFRAFARWTVQEITKLLTPANGHSILKDSAAGEGPDNSRPLRPSDIAVLVDINRNGAKIIRLLKRAGINAVGARLGNVFASAEAKELRAIFAAMLRPGDYSALATALTTRPGGLDLSEVAGFEENTDKYIRHINAFARYAAIWKNTGIFGALSAFFRDRRSNTGLAGSIDGDRAIANIRHLAELASVEEKKRALGPDGLIAWYEKKMVDSESSAEDEEQRIESDDDAVRVMSVHSSKGLEFPVVFLPYQWAGLRKENKDRPKIFHDADEQETSSRKIDLFPDGTPEVSDMYKCEQKGGDARLLYVGITRAKYRCYLMWAAQGNRSPRMRPWVLDALIGVPFNRSTFTSRTGDNGMIADCVNNEGDKMQEISINASTADFELHSLDEQLTRQRYFNTSFSKLKGTELKGEIEGGDDEIHLPVDSQESESDRPVPTEKANTSAQHIGGGSSFGSLFHEVIERMHRDGKWNGEESVIRGIIDEESGKFGFDPTRGSDHPLLGEILRLVKLALTTPVTCGADTFSFGEIEAKDRLVELKFEFPFDHLSNELLADILRRSDSVSGKRIAEKVKMLRFQLSTGYMGGAIDLIFRRPDGKYYLLDWKTNSNIGDSNEEVEAAMDDNHYTLQSLIYAVTLHRYLKHRMPDYDPTTHFGGIIYTFVRTMGGANSGIYLDLEIGSSIERLSELFGESEPEGAAQ